MAIDDVDDEEDDDDLDDVETNDLSFVGIKPDDDFDFLGSLLMLGLFFGGLIELDADVGADVGADAGSLSSDFTFVFDSFVT